MYSGWRSNYTLLYSPLSLYLLYPFLIYTEDFASTDDETLAAKLPSSVLTVFWIILYQRFFNYFKSVICWQTKLKLNALSNNHISELHLNTIAIYSILIGVILWHDRLVLWLFYLKNLLYLASAQTQLLVINFSIAPIDIFLYSVLDCFIIPPWSNSLFTNL